MNIIQFPLKRKTPEERATEKIEKENGWAFKPSSMEMNGDILIRFRKTKIRKFNWREFKFRDAWFIEELWIDTSWTVYGGDEFDALGLVTELGHCWAEWCLPGE